MIEKVKRCLLNLVLGWETSIKNCFLFFFCFFSWAWLALDWANLAVLASSLFSLSFPQIEFSQVCPVQLWWPSKARRFSESATGIFSFSHRGEKCDCLFFFLLFLTVPPHLRGGLRQVVFGLKAFQKQLVDSHKQTAVEITSDFPWVPNSVDVLVPGIPTPCRTQKKSGEIHMLRSVRSGFPYCLFCVELSWVVFFRETF